MLIFWDGGSTFFSLIFALLSLYWLKLGSAHCVEKGGQTDDSNLKTRDKHAKLKKINMQLESGMRAVMQFFRYINLKVYLASHFIEHDMC